MSKKKSIYLPKKRTSYEPKQSALISYGKTEPNFTMLPNLVEDPIAVNNIANAEFDYTENLISDDEE
jgi:hypothetical protein